MTTTIDYLITQIEKHIEHALTIEHRTVRESNLHEAFGMIKALSIIIGYSNAPESKQDKSKELLAQVLDLMRI